MPQLAKLVKVDAVLPARRFTQRSDEPNKLEISEEFNVNVPAGSLAMLDFHGVHMNREDLTLCSFNMFVC